jgi:DNA mismatch repair ATPase MutS
MNDWISPDLIDSISGSAFAEVLLEGLRHPILEYQLGVNCVSSNFNTTNGRAVIITGPVKL